jgi:hypothetical protein
VADALPGQPSPLGATLRDGGVNFAVASSVAEAAEICLFDYAGAETRLRLPDYDGGAWHGFGPGAGPGQAYGFRVHGPRHRPRAALQPGQAAARPGRRDRAHPGRQQQRVLPGQRDLLGGLGGSGRRVAFVYAAPGGVAAVAPGNYFKEILVNSDNLVHLFMRSASNPDVAAVIICSRQVSIGMLFAQARAVMRDFDAVR